MTGGTIFCKLLCSIVLLGAAVDGARILFLVGITTKSHRSMFDPLSEALAERGHEIVYASIYPSKRNVTNVKEIGVELDITHIVNNFFEKDGPKFIDMFSNFFFKIPELIQAFLRSPDIQQLLQSDHQKFDLAVYDAMFNEYSLGLVHHLKVPLIYMCTTISCLPWTHDLVGHPNNYAYEPSIFLDFGTRMTFKERVINTITNDLLRAFQKYVNIPRTRSHTREIYGDDIPSIPEIENKSVSLVFSNSHPSVGYPRPFAANMVEVGGLHCRKAKPLPKDLAAFADGSGEHGFIYFSFGSMVRASHMPDDLRNGLLEMFASLPQRVIWKWDSDHMDNLPSNVKLGKWLPQQDILGHPKIRAFITHGGLFSTYEAIYHNVPLIGIPFFGDQDMNMNDAVKKGYAVKISVADFNRTSLQEALDKVLNTDIYREAMTYRSALFRDQLTTPLERAVYWVEYVLRYGGAPHLRSAATELSWIQYNLIDVYAFLVAVLCAVVSLTYYVMSFVYRKLRYLLSSNKKLKTT